jgi:glucose-1-phosphate cytidylyltransferase
MKTVILCGGHGIRLSEETLLKPKPMVEIGDNPILWHIMQIYAHYGFEEFILALGYKGNIIKEYMLKYYTFGDLTVELGTQKVLHGKTNNKNLKVHMIDTGYSTMTGGRLHRLEPHLRDEGTFMLTYGDGVSDVNISDVLTFHKQHGKIATLTAVRPPARFGTMQFDGNKVIEFKEKPQTREGWINGGFYVFEPKVFDYLHGNQTILEADPLERLAADGQLMAYRHEGFWQCMDTLRDKLRLEELWESGKAPWKVWES